MCSGNSKLIKKIWHRTTLLTLCLVIIGFLFYLGLQIYYVKKSDLFIPYFAAYFFGLFLLGYKAAEKWCMLDAMQKNV